MQVQVNVIFDMETELERSATISRIARMLEAVGVSAAVVPLPGNGTDTDEAPMRVGGAAQTLEPAPVKTPSPGRVAAAANARAAKQAQAKLSPPPPPDDLAGGTNGAADSDADDDALGLNSPSMSPGEAKDAALALVREAYSAGHVAQVKALQKELGVAKFYDVDVTTGHAFYQRVMKLAHEVGIRR
jgi:hypothetical protein